MNHDHWSAATMAAPIPQTESMRAPAQPPAVDLAWSAEQPAPMSIQPRRRRLIPSNALAFVAGAAVIAAVAGLAGALHGGGHSAAVDTTTLTAPAPLPVSAPPPPTTPVPTPVPKPARPTHSVTTHHVTAGSVSHPSVVTPSPPPVQNVDSPPPAAPSPPNWNRALFFYWLTHRHHGFGHWH